MLPYHNHLTLTRHDEVFYQGAHIYPNTPMAAPCSRQGTTGLSNICLPLDYKWLKPLNCTGCKSQIIPQSDSFASNQSPGLNLLFDRNIA